MKKMTLPARDIPFFDGYDVLVCGGGPAGCAAAIAAARHGAKTLLIEASYALGGMSTLGMVPTWCPFSDKQKIIYRGIAEEIFNAGKKATPHVPSEQLDWVPIDPEALKRIYDELLADAGVQVLFGTFLCGAQVENGTVTSVLGANKDGLCAFGAKVFLDCTGDADLAFYAGAECVCGDGKGHVQAATHCFELGGVKDQAYLTGTRLHGSNPQSPIHAIVQSGRFPEIDDSHICQSLIRPHTVGFNAGHIWNVNSTDAASVSRAMREGRRKAKAYCDALREYAPEAFSDAYVAETAPLMGIRESRRVIGDCILTKDDYLARRSFPDEIGRNSYYLDIHMTPEEKAVSEHQSFRYGKGESHGIPYRCLTPRGLSNLLVAGRCISTDRAVQGSTRVMPVCLVTGQAAGTAAALVCHDACVNVHQADIAALREALRTDGAYFL